MAHEDGSTNERDISIEASERLTRHLSNWLGKWPPDGDAVVYSSYRELPGWDGQIRPIVGVGTPEAAVLSVAQQFLRPLEDALDDGGLANLEQSIGNVIGIPGALLRRGVFRYCQRLVAHEELGVWKKPDDPLVPEWLRPFNKEVLLAFDALGNYAAGVGRKGHDEYGQELSIVTEPAFHHRGYARNLVAQAARRVFDEGSIATYLHRPDNLGSAAVAESAGFFDQGWTVIGLSGVSP